MSLNSAIGNRYKAYPEYKDSGVEWLGEIPSGWEVTPVKYLADLTPKKPNRTKDLLSKECSFIPMEKLKLDKLELDETKLISEVFDGYTYFENDDVLIAKVTPCFENKNMAVASNLRNGIGFGSSEIYVLRADKKAHNRYLFYRLQESVFMSIAISNMTGAGGLRRVPADTISNYSIAIPAKSEQEQISSFLDYETAKIDILIEKQQRLIELLTEKRQAVISHAVTKGLNPDVPMKDSGVEWLGEVPGHWDVKKIKHFGRVKGGFAFKSGDFVETGYPVLKISNISHLSLNFDDASFLPNTYADIYSEYKAGKNSLAFAMTRPIISGGIKVTRVPNSEKMPLINQRVGFLSLDDEYLLEFILFSSMSNSFASQFSNNMTITNQPNISSEGIESVYIPIPPRNELVEIVDKLKTKEAEFQELQKLTKSQVELLQERRTALISAAVTGKIDVRDWVKPE